MAFQLRTSKLEGGLILLVFISWTKFLTLLWSPPLRSGTNKMKGRKQMKGNKRTSTSEFLALRENTNRMSLRVWFCIPGMWGGVSRRISWIESIKVWHLKDPGSHRWLSTMMALPVGAHVSAWKAELVCLTPWLWPDPPATSLWGGGGTRDRVIQPVPPSPTPPRTLTVYAGLASSAATFLIKSVWAYKQIWQFFFFFFWEREREKKYMFR